VLYVVSKYPAQPAEQLSSEQLFLKLRRLGARWDSTACADAVWRLYWGGYTWQEIADGVGLSRADLWRRFRRRGSEAAAVARRVERNKKTAERRQGLREADRPTEPSKTSPRFQLLKPQSGFPPVPAGRPGASGCLPILSNGDGGGGGLVSPPFPSGGSASSAHQRARPSKDLTSLAGPPGARGKGARAGSAADCAGRSHTEEAGRPVPEEDDEPGLPPPAQKPSGTTDDSSSQTHSGGTTSAKDQLRRGARNSALLGAEIPSEETRLFSKKSMFSCPVCGLDFDDADELKFHVGWDHGD
jgi:hypothetical protein